MISIKWLKKLRNDKGAIAPVMVIIAMIIFYIGVMYFVRAQMINGRIVARQAFDSGIISSLAAAAEEKNRSTHYDETIVGVEYLWEMRCRRRVCDDGEPPSCHWKYWEEDVCSLKAWKNTEQFKQNYIYLDINKAKDIAEQYIDENLKLNLGDKARLKNFSYNVTYDDDRKFIVEKQRYIKRPDKRGREPSGWNDPGVPAETSKYRKKGVKLLNNPSWNEFNGKAWWMVEFKDARPSKLSKVQNWTNQRNEEREVYYPRWVEVDAEATITIDVPFGKLFGMPEEVDVYAKYTGVKELVEPTK
ncbi:MAG: hypothetical protein MJA82_08480 [Clostridia bacterium]|nr:hypothetical protein [Clostridia bacterium]